MKISISIIVFFSLFLTKSAAQTVNDVPIKDINVDYVQIIGTTKPLSNKVNIQLDFGQENKLFKASDTVVKDEKGNVLTLNSMIDALNFMSSNGYEFADSYVIATGSVFMYYYLLKKRK